MDIVDSQDSNIVDRAVSVLKSGGLIVYPTETAYGVGVDATNLRAVSRLLEYKKRPEGKAISIGCSDKSMAEEYVEINSTAENIYTQFLPGPVTVISKSKGKVDERLESENGTLGIRIPDAEPILTIIKGFGKPVTTTSANSAGKKTPYSIKDVLDTLSERQKALIDLMIDGGTLPKRQTSTVIDTTTEQLKTYRQGSINFQDPKSNVQEIVTGAVNETIELAERLMSENMELLSDKPVVFLLNGELGAGKTHFVKGIAKALGIGRTIKSPTYTYVSEYKYSKNELQGKLFHLDAWRINNISDLENLDVKSWMEPGNIIAVEWPEILSKLGAQSIFTNAQIVRLNIESGESETERIFKIY